MEFLFLKIPVDYFDQLLHQYLVSRDKKTYSEFDTIDWIEVTKLYKSLIMRKTGAPFPQDAFVQLQRSLQTINSELHSTRIAETSKYFHNSGNFSILLSESVVGLSCLGYSRNSETGERGPYGKYIPNSTTEEVEYDLWKTKSIIELESEDHDAFQSITSTISEIEKYYKSPRSVDIVYDGTKSIVLRIRKLRFKGTSAFTAAVQMVEDNLITKEDGISFITSEDVKELFVSTFATQEEKTVLTKGFASSTSTVTGRLCYTLSDCLAAKKEKQNPILVKSRLLPQDFLALTQAKALITSIGNEFSSEIYISRTLHITSAIGCPDLEVTSTSIKVNGQEISFGSDITVGGNGEVYSGKYDLKRLVSFDNANATAILGWADEVRNGKIYLGTYAHNLDEIKIQPTVGSDEIGLYHFESLLTGKRTDLLAGFIRNGNEKYLQTLESQLTKDFSSILLIAKDQLFTIQLLNAPQISYFPKIDDIQKEIELLKKKLEEEDENPNEGGEGEEEEDNKAIIQNEITTKESLIEVIDKLVSTNPLLAIRGIRMSILNPKILQLQVNTIINSIKEAVSKGAEPKLRVLFPNVISSEEIDFVLSKFYDDSVQQGSSVLNLIQFGIRIESPRSCLAAAKLASKLSLILLDSDTLHQNGFGMAKEDSIHTFLTEYVNLGKLDHSPFESIDQEGIGQLYSICSSSAKSSNEGVTISIFGDNTEDLDAIDFSIKSGITSFVSPPVQVPVYKICIAKSLISQSKK